MIIWLASYPRSGNTLLRTILKQSFDINSYDYEARLRSESITEPLNQKVKRIVGHKKFTQPWTAFYTTKKSSPETFYVKTHSPPMDEQPAIYIVRDGRSATDSYQAYQKSYQAKSPSITQLTLGDDYYGSWSENFAHWNNGKRPLLLLHFEDLVTPDSVLLKKIADFIGYNKEPKPFINPMDKVHQQNPDFFRQGNKEWQPSKKWSPIDEAAFLVVHAELMQSMGYVSEDEVADARQVFGNAQCNYLEQAKNGFMERNTLQHSAEQKNIVIDDLLTKIDTLKLSNTTATALSVSNEIPIISNILKKAAIIIKPRLGWLVQYQPRKMNLAEKTEATPLSDYPKLSIVTPSFGQADFIERTIKSVLDQKYPNLEYFVQDGGSTDDTVNILKEFEDGISGWKSETDSGQSQAINRGFSNTSGEIMAWLNSDDLFLPGAINTVIEYFNKHPDVDAVYGNRLMINDDDMEIGRWILPDHCEKTLPWADYIPQETLFWRRSIWDKAGGKIDESFRFAMDWDLLTRFHNAGAKFGHIPQFLGAFRVHPQQKTSAAMDEIGLKEMTIIRERELGYAPTRKNIKKAILPFMLRHLFFDLKYRVKQRYNAVRS
ncbi:glycosyltransferase [Cycloclasticus sp.]|uniref:glycosyltransferase n=1 Tax=Cycloclasticus sp. TaxID=2024830 RepID=UPI002579949C|nr:glycosyltransferase [Cycloclasticus sp.]